MTENEQKYFDEVVGVLKAKGNIGFMDRPKLARLGTSLGLPVARTLELDGEAKTFLKQENARLAEEERLRKEQESAAAEERRKAEEERLRKEREAAEAEECRRKDEEKRKQAEEAAAAEEQRQQKVKAQAAQRRQQVAVDTDKPAKTTADSQSAGCEEHRQEKVETTDSKQKYRPGIVNWCVMSFAFLAMISVFWSGHWMAGILLSIVPILALEGCGQGSDDESDFAPWRWLVAAGVYGFACYAGISGRWFVAVIVECCVLIPLAVGRNK